MTTETVSPTPIEFFAFQSWTMRLLGSSMKRIENTRGNRLRSLVNCLTFPWIILPLGYTTVLSYPDITAICSMMGLVTGFVMASVKLPSLHCNVESFVGVRDKILQLWTRVGCGEDTDLRRYVRFVQRFSQANAFALVVGSVTYLMAPLFITMFQYFHGESIEIWPAPFFGNYYFDIQYSPAYELVFLYAFYSICLCVVLCNAIDSVFFESCLIVACHFKILQTRLRTLDFRSDAFRENLIDLVKYQMQIYEATEAIQKAFFTILPPFFIVASMMFCAELYTSTLVKGALVLVYVGYSFSCLCQIFFYTYGGHEMILESERLNTAIYSNLGWYEAEPWKRKLIIIVMIRAQKVCLLRAGFFDVSLVTFSKIVSSTFSYIALLQSFQEE